MVPYGPQSGQTCIPTQSVGTRSKKRTNVMQLAQVIGQAISTVKHPSLHGWRLLVVQPLTDTGKNDGDPIVAIDSLGAGRSDRVIVSSDGAGTRKLLGHKDSPVRWMVMGICDS